MRIHDDKLPQDLLLKCTQEAEECKTYGVLHQAGNGSYGFKYNWLVTDPESKVINSKNISKLWEHVKTFLPANIQLHRAYVNSHTYGIEDTIHEDDEDIEDGLTVIVYLCNAWYPEWFGQTVFFETLSNQQNEIVASVLPKPNRFIVFNKKDPHCVAPLSRRFAGVRLTCMFKVELLDDTA
jgi:hypothetical protein